MEKKIYVDRIFPTPKKKDDYRNILIDAESLMYVTNFKDSQYITSAICTHINKVKKAEISTIVDATGGIGGDTISFASKFFRVISIELDEHRFTYLTNNIKIYNLQNVIEIKGDSIDIIPKLTNIDVVYIDPPWGGKTYKDKKVMRITMNDMEIEEIICNFLSRDKMLISPKIIALKLPKNYDIRYLYERIKKDRDIKIYLYQLPKMLLIVIENFS